MAMLFPQTQRHGAPWPFDFRLAGVGLMGGTAKQSSQSMVSTKAPDMANVAPTDYSYSSADPRIERVQSYRRFLGGFGLQKQETADDGRYHHCTNALCYADAWSNGPNIETYTPGTTDATNGVIKGFTIGATEYALVGRYVLKRVSDASWTVEKDFGAAKAGVDVTVFADNATGTPRAYVAMGTSDFDWHFDGTTWTQFATFQSRAYCGVGRELYRASDTNLVSKVNTNASPIVEANWGAANQFRVGSKDHAITRMVENAVGQIVILKTDRPYSLDGSGQDIAYFGSMRPAPDAYNGKAVALHLNDVWVNYRNGYHRITADWQLIQAGPELQNQADWLAGMRVTAGLGHDNLFLLAAVTDGSDGYLMLLPAGGGWHGSISVKFTGKEIRALWKSTVGAPTGHARLYVGFSDGTLGWTTLPNSFDWSLDTACAFSTSDGEIYLPDMTGERDADPKPLLGVTVTGPRLDGNRYAQFEFKVAPLAAAYTALGVNFDADREFGEFADNTSGTIIKPLVRLKNAATTSCPRVASVGLHYRVKPEPRLIHEFWVIADAGLTNHLGTPLLYGAKKIRQHVRTCRDTQGSVELRLPDGASQQVTIIDVLEQTVWDRRFRQWRAGLKITAAQFKTNVTHGTHARLMNLGTHAALAALGSHARMQTY